MIYAFLLWFNVMYMKIKPQGLLSWQLATPQQRRYTQPMFKRDLTNIKVRLERAEHDSLEPVRKGE